MKKIKHRVAVMFMAGACSLMPLSLRSAETYTAYAADFWESGYDNEYFYDFWNQNYTGTVSGEKSGINGFKCSWSGIENFIYGKGIKFDEYKSPYKFNKFDIEYDADIKTPDNSMFEVMGYMGKEGNQPAIEFYIVEGWGSWRPPGDVEALGTFESNGATYEIIRSRRIGQICDFGTPPYQPEQYWSVRVDGQLDLEKENHLSNKVNLVDHFKAWHKAGLYLDDVLQVTLEVTGFRSSGEAEVKELRMTTDIGDDNADWVKAEEPVYAEPDENGIYYRFSELKDDNIANPLYAIDMSEVTDYSASDKKVISLKDSDRRGSNGMYFTLPENLIRPGGTYSIGLYAKQDDLDEAELTLSFYSSSKDQRIGHQEDVIQTVKMKKGEWTKIESPNFTVSDNKGFREYTVDVRVFDHNGENYVDLLIDDFEIAVEGYEKKAPVSIVPSQKKGDLNRDGVVDVFDIILCRRALTALMNGNETKYNADLNEDGEISVSDLVMLHRYVSGKRSAFDPVKEK